VKSTGHSYVCFQVDLACFYNFAPLYFVLHFRDIKSKAIPVTVREGP
jgi:hypothetical protein